MDRVRFRHKEGQRVSEPAASRVRGQDFYDYHKYPHRVYLNRFGDANEKLPLSDFLNLVFERAILHEQDVIKHLPFRAPEGKTVEEQAISTLQLMSAGTERIFQAVLIEGNNSGKPDLLERVPGKSKFGDFFYKPVDIKSGSGYENEEKGILRDDYGLQLYHYGVLLDKAQGAFPPEGEILNRDKQRVLYKLPQFAQMYAQVYPEIAALIAGKKTDEPARSGACKDCQWWGHCEDILTAAADVSLLPDIGRSKRALLVSIGVRTMQDVIGHDFEATPVRAIGAKTAENIKRAARAITSGKSDLLAKPAVPDAALKIYFDFEDDPTQELIYLCGRWVEPAVDGLNYFGLFAEDSDKEKKLWEDFQKFCGEIDGKDFVVFHYSPYEKTKLTQLENRYGATEKKALDNFRSRMHDLQKIVGRSIVLPERSYGLKAVAPYAGHKYTEEKAGGAQSIVWFHEYQQNPERAKPVSKLLIYNSEDCQAMKAICDWLRSL